MVKNVAVPNIRKNTRGINIIQGSPGGGFIKSTINAMNAAKAKTASGNAKKSIQIEYTLFAEIFGLASHRLDESSIISIRFSRINLVYFHRVTALKQTHYAQEVKKMTANIDKLGNPDTYAWLETYGETSEDSEDYAITIPVWSSPIDKAVHGKSVKVYDMQETGSLLGYIPESLYTDIFVQHFYPNEEDISTYDHLYDHEADSDVYEAFAVYQCAGFGYSKLPIMGQGPSLCQYQIMPASSFMVLSQGTNIGPLPDIISPQDNEYSWVMDSYGKSLGLVASWHSFASVPENIGQSEFISTEAPDGKHVFSSPSSNSVEWLIKTTRARAESFDVPFLGEVFPCHESASNYELRNFSEDAE